MGSGDLEAVRLQDEGRCSIKRVLKEPHLKVSKKKAGLIKKAVRAVAAASLMKRGERTQRRSAWTASDIRDLKRLYGKSSTKSLARRLSRSPEAIRAKARTLGLKSKPAALPSVLKGKAETKSLTARRKTGKKHAEKRKG